jgi:hypothetical protein
VNIAMPIAVVNNAITFTLPAGFGETMVCGPSGSVLPWHHAMQLSLIADFDAIDALLHCVCPTRTSISFVVSRSLIDMESIFG